MNSGLREAGVWVPWVWGPLLSTSLILDGRGYKAKPRTQDSRWVRSTQRNLGPVELSWELEGGGQVPRQLAALEAQPSLSSPHNSISGLHLRQTPLPTLGELLV